MLGGTGADQSSDVSPSHEEAEDTEPAERVAIGGVSVVSYAGSYKRGTREPIPQRTS
jgi:hypothetical protein